MQYHSICSVIFSYLENCCKSIFSIVGDSLSREILVLHHNPLQSIFFADCVKLYYVCIYVAVKQRVRRVMELFVQIIAK